MGFWAFFTILFTFLASCAAHLIAEDFQIGQNVIQNGGFETGSWWPHWNYAIGNTTNTPGFTGLYRGSLNAVQHVFDSIHSIAEYTPITVAPGLLFKFSFDARLNRKNCTAFFYQNYGDTPFVIGNATYSTGQVAGGALGPPVALGKWSLYSTYFLTKLNPSSTFFPAINLFCGENTPDTTDVVDFDNFLLSQVSNKVYSTASAGVGSNLLTNGDFSKGSSSFQSRTYNASFSLARPGFGNSPTAVRVQLAANKAVSGVAFNQQIQTVPGGVYICSIVWRTANVTSSGDTVTFNMLFTDAIGFQYSYSIDPIQYPLQTAIQLEQVSADTGAEWQALSGVIAATSHQTVVQASISGRTNIPFEIGELRVQRLD